MLHRACFRHTLARSNLIHVQVISKKYASSNANKLDAMMRDFEDKEISRIEPMTPFYVRLDGSNFGSFVKKKPSLKLPWDERC